MIDTLPPADPHIVEAWLRARSHSRGLPQPVADHGGLRVDTASVEETARYVFAAPVEGISRLGEKITEPRIFIKLCGPADLLRSLLPAHWTVRPVTVMMTGPEEQRQTPPLPQGFSLDVTTADDRTQVRILAEDGRLAARGHAAEREGVFAYDRIMTEPDFRRIGLGTVVMTALGAARRSSSSLRILAATDAGRALYQTLGWRVYSLYSTASIEEASSA
jgi:GNAT superfamily N-acetyltransferase